MVVIRLARSGAKKAPFYHLVVTDKRNRRDGRFIERVGYFNPTARGQAARLLIESERVDHWISKGAQPSPRVVSLLKELKNNEGKEVVAAPTRNEAKKVQAAHAEQAAKKRALEEKAAADAAAKAEAEEAAKAAAEAKATEAKAAEEAPADKAE